MASSQFKLTTNPATQNVHLNLWLSFKTTPKKWDEVHVVLIIPFSSRLALLSFICMKRNHLNVITISWQYIFHDLNFILFIFFKKIIYFLIFCAAFSQQMEISELLAFVREALVGDFRHSSLTRLWKRKVIQSKHR